VKANLRDLLASGQTIIADGGMGTMLFAQGLKRGDAPEIWNVEQPEKVRSVHRGYIQAGAQIILTNSFGGNRVRLAMHNLESRASALNEAAARLARAEADAAPNPVIVGGSMGPMGQFIEPLGVLTFEEAVSVFEEQARALVAGGVDVLWIETMSDLEEVRAAVQGCRRSTSDVPVVTTMTFDSGGRTMMGVTPEKALETLDGFDVVALGANCGNGPDEIEAVIGQMHASSSHTILVAKANAGLPHMVDNQAVYDATPEVMAEYARRVYNQGAQIIGACCGSTPEHIRAIAEALR
jgi:5-methyltetrahydrofolate--homocysteine methyltransferase